MPIFGGGKPTEFLRTSAQQVDNAMSEWIAGTVGSIARDQILMALSALAHEAFVKSTVDRDDRPKLIARLTAKGETAIKKAFETSAARFRTVAWLTPAELVTLTSLLRRVRVRTFHLASTTRQSGDVQHGAFRRPGTLRLHFVFATPDR